LCGSGAGGVIGGPIALYSPLYQERRATVV
jgi:hypothetical protein